MGIIKRFQDIMASNINALLDKAEDPAKMIDQILRELESDLGNVKAETASIMAEEKRAYRQLEDNRQEINKMEQYAKKALMASNEEDAKIFLEKKVQLNTVQTSLQQSYEAAKANADKMRDMHDKLVKDINELNGKRDAIKAKVSVARTQEKINKIGSSMGNVNAGMSAFDRMEAKADRMLDEANAMSELGSSPANPVDELAAMYDTKENTQVDDELAALKAEMGL